MSAAFLFDIDGTLIDSVDLHAEAWQRALAHFGFDEPFEAVRSQIGKGGDQLLPVFVPADALERLGDHGPRRHPAHERARRLRAARRQRLDVRHRRGDLAVE